MAHVDDTIVAGSLAELVWLMVELETIMVLNGNSEPVYGSGTQPDGCRVHDGEPEKW